MDNSRDFQLFFFCFAFADDKYFPQNPSQNASKESIKAKFENPSRTFENFISVFCENLPSSDIRVLTT
jgi:hypothetical protein